MLSLDFDTTKVLALIERTGSQGVRTARKAGSSALRSMKAEASRQIRARWNIKASRIAKTLSLIFPRSGADLVWILRSSYGPTPLADFGARQTSKGVSVLIYKNGSRTLIQGAFLATMKSGHRGVFERTGEFGRRGNPKLEKIAERFGPKISNAFKDVSLPVLARGREVFLSTFKRLTAGE